MSSVNAPVPLCCPPSPERPKYGENAIIAGERFFSIYFDQVHPTSIVSPGTSRVSKLTALSEGQHAETMSPQRRNT